MPIFMDRHDVSSSVTAEDVAMLHQKDLKIQDQFQCRGLTYWFDDKRKTAFCLIEAPDKKALQKMHDTAHGQVPHSIIEVDPGIVESFLGRLEDPERGRSTGLNIITDTAFRTIMVVALNWSGLVVEKSSGIKSQLRNFNIAVRKILDSYEGNVVKHTAYYYQVSFKSVTLAVQAATNILETGKELFEKKIKLKKILKIGLNAGVPVTQKQLIFEDTIKLAERMCDWIKGEMIVSSEVKDLYKSENANSFIKGKSVVALTRDNEKFVTLLMDYTDTSWNKPNLKVDNFTKPLRCSKSQLYRKMILLTGTSPNTFLKEYRLNKALNLLVKNQGNISEIAFETGFSTPSYFTKCFKKKFGVLPASYLNLSK
jgi:AraC-like DNA-binding protein